jgi:hypothetical protein
MKRLQSAKSIRSSGVPCSYEVIDSDNPSCTCEDFMRHSFPCKHILSRWIDEHGNLTIPSSNLDPWITRDDGSPSYNEPVAETGHMQSQQSSGLPFDDTDTVENTADNTPGLEPLLQTVRKQIDFIKSWTYLTVSSAAVQEVSTILDKAINEHLSTDSIKMVNNLPHLPASSKKKRKCLTKGKLPFKKQCLAQERVGLRADYRVSNLEECNMTRQHSMSSFSKRASTYK